MRGADAGLRVPLAPDAGLRQVPAGQRHVHHRPERQGGGRRGHRAQQPRPRPGHAAWQG